MKLFAPLLTAGMLIAGTAAAQSTPAQPAPAPAQAPQAAPASGKPSVDATPIDELLQNPAAMEVLFKHFPEMKGQEDQLAMAGSMTLRDVQPFAADTFTDEKLAAVEVDFQALP